TSVSTSRPSRVWWRGTAAEALRATNCAMVAALAAATSGDTRSGSGPASPGTAAKPSSGPDDCATAGSPSSSSSISSGSGSGGDGSGATVTGGSGATTGS